MVGFIDQHRETYGVEPICAVLPIAPSPYFLHKAQQRDPRQGSARARRDAALRSATQRIWDENEQVYGPRKVWQQLRREGHRVARCTVERVMRAIGVAGDEPRPRLGDHDPGRRGRRSAGRSGRSPIMSRRTGGWGRRATASPCRTPTACAEACARRCSTRWRWTRRPFRSWTTGGTHQVRIVLGRASG
jgi:putative transposase